MKAFTLRTDPFAVFTHGRYCVFAQLGCITRTRNKFVENVAALERYLITISGINEAAVPDILFHKIS